MFASACTQAIVAVVRNDSTLRILHEPIWFFFCACVSENYLGGEGSRKIGRSSAVGDENNQDDQQLHGDACMLEPLLLLLNCLRKNGPFYTR